MHYMSSIFFHLEIPVKVLYVHFLFPLYLSFKYVSLGLLENRPYSHLKVCSNLIILYHLFSI